MPRLEGDCRTLSSPLTDCPGIFKEHPKSIERQRQDHPVNQDHQHINVHDDMKIPPKWREIIDCRI